MLQKHAAATARRTVAAPALEHMQLRVCVLVVTPRADGDVLRDKSGQKPSRTVSRRAVKLFRRGA